MSGPALIYDPRFHTFESWASLMVELYSAQNLEIPTHGTTWQGWAVGIKSIDVFASEAIPDPYIFDDWMEWAQMTVNAVNPRT